MQIEKIKELIQYIVAEAAKNEFPDSSLGPIHIIKYVYLVDLEYAKHYRETFTGINWQFYSYGPWNLDLYNFIDSSLEESFFRTKFIESHYDKDDFKRFTCIDAEKADIFYNKFDVIVSGAIGKYVSEFGQDTESLLEFVYNTEPILVAAPGDILDFSNLKNGFYNRKNVSARKDKQSLTAKQEKKRKEKLKKLKEKFQNDVRELVQKRDQYKDCKEPAYDKVYEEGVKYLDSLAGAELEEGRYSIKVADEYWKSKSRFDPEIP